MENWLIFKIVLKSFSWFKKLFKRPRKSIRQVQHVGDNSIGIQSSGDVHVSFRGKD